MSPSTLQQPAMPADPPRPADSDMARLRAHAVAAPGAGLASVLVASLLVWAVGPAIAPLRLGGWLVALGLAIALRVGLPLWQRRAAQAASGAAVADARRPLRRCRLAIGLHGAVWGAVAWLPASLADPALQAGAVMLLGGLAVGAMTLTLFDLAAALLFAAPLLLPLALRLLSLEAPLARNSLVAGAVLLLLAVVSALAGRRIERQRIALAATRHAEQLARGASESAQAAAAEQQRMLALVMQRTEQGFWFIDNELRTTDANPAMCRMLGVERAQLLGRSIHDFADAANRAVFDAQAQRRAAGLAGGYEITLTRADGSSVHCFNNATPVFDSQGRKIGALGLFSDISARKQAEQQIRQAGELLAQKTHVLEITLDSLSQGVLTVDPDGRCIAWNRRLLELLRLPPALMQGQPRLETLLDWQREQGEFGNRLERLDEGGRLSVGQALEGAPLRTGHRYRRTRADGTVLDVVTRFAADGSLVRTFTDISAGVAAKQALVDAREQAERARETAESASRAKSEFLSRMSHELRTPLNAILGFGQLLRVDADDPPSPGQRQRLDELLRGAHHLLALIDDVLDVARIEAGNLPLSLQPVDLAALAQEGPNLVRPVAQPWGVVPATLPSAPDRPLDVLYIDDNEVNQVLMQGMLAHRPAIALRQALLPEEGLAMAAAQPPDLVLLDIQLPGIDGFEVLRRLRRLRALRDTPVIAVSANAMPDDLADARRAGFADYLTKPVDMRRLLALVDNALG